MEIDLQLALWQWAAVFAVGAGVMVRAGITLAESGDEIAELTGLGRLLVGSLLVAGATSLPEVFTDMSASLVGAPDIAIGDLFGSSMANMAILAIIDIAHRGRVWPSVELGHSRLASIGIVLTGIAVLSILTPSWLAIGWVGIDTILIFVVYAAVIAWMRRSPVREWQSSSEPVPRVEEERGGEDRQATTIRREATRFGISAFVILLIAPVVAVSGQGVARESGLGETFVGTLFVAIATSLPELVASLAALRIGAYDLAVGNVYGSNAFNMTIMLFADIAYTPGPILAAVDPSQAVAGVGAILLMGLSLAAIVHGKETRIQRLEPDAALLLVVYVGLLFAVWGAST